MTKRAEGKLWDWYRSEMSSNRHLLSISGTALVAFKKKKKAHGIFNHCLNWNSFIKGCFLRKLFVSWVVVVIYSQQQVTNPTGSTKRTVTATKWAKILVCIQEWTIPNTLTVGKGKAVWWEIYGDSFIVPVGKLHQPRIGVVWMRCYQALHCIS